MNGSPSRELIGVALLVGFTSVPSFAQPQQAVETADSLLSLYAGSNSAGAAFAVVQDGETLYMDAAGMADLAHDIPFEIDTPTNIGSTSKQFTAFAILLLAEDDSLSLDDTVREYIPELPEFDHTVTIRHLLSHTSGYREFINLLMLGGRRIDRGDWIDRDEIIDTVRRQEALQNEPGAEWNYNNTAFGLAAVIVERVSGRPFHEFMAERVFDPLGMNDAMVRPTPEHIVPGRALGYAPVDSTTYIEKRDIGASTGAGGIYSTVRDLTKWIDNFSDPVVGTPSMIDQMTTSNVLTDGEESGYGLGLFIDEYRGLKRVHHGGADIAHRSQLIWFPEIDAGLTTQSNHAAFNAGGTANQLADAFFSEYMKGDEPVESTEGEGFDPASYDPESFDKYVGRYALDIQPNFILNFFREDTTLYTQATGQQRIPIAPTSDSTFVIEVVSAKITFHENADGEVTGLTLDQNGIQHATRLDDDEKEEWTPTAADLQAYEGRYLSDEVETFYMIRADGDTLRIDHRRFDEMPMRPTAEDEFSFITMAPTTVEFERDRAGNVIALYMSNGRTRDVRFRRVE